MDILLPNATHLKTELSAVYIVEPTVKRLSYSRKESLCPILSPFFHKVYNWDLHSKYLSHLPLFYFSLLVFMCCQNTMVLWYKSLKNITVTFEIVVFFYFFFWLVGWFVTVFHSLLFHIL